MRFPVLLVLVLSGCTSASMMETRGRSEYAPTNERAGGRVRYRSNAAAFIVRAQRDDAYRQMHESCGGAYRITNEWDEVGGTVSSANATVIGHTVIGSGYSAVIAYRLVDFECEERRAPAADRSGWSAEGEEPSSAGKTGVTFGGGEPR